MATVHSNYWETGNPYQAPQVSCMPARTKNIRKWAESTKADVIQIGSAIAGSLACLFTTTQYLASQGIDLHQDKNTVLMLASVFGSAFAGMVAGAVTGEKVVNKIYGTPTQDE